VSARWVERAVGGVLAARGYRSRRVETAIARHHAYDARGHGRLPPIVLLPGLADTAASLAPVLLALRGRARRVIVVEAAGHGRSGRARVPYTAERHFESTAAALDQLLDEPAVLVGNSLGGAAALYYAAERAPRVRGLLLTSPAGAVVDPAHVDEVRRAFAIRTLGDARAFVDRVVHRPVPLLAPLFARVVLARAASPAVRDILSGDQHALPADRLSRIRAPLMLVWGRSERLLPRASLDYFRTHLPAHAEVVEPDGLGHCPHLDDPARLVRMIVGFAGRVSTR